MAPFIVLLYTALALTSSFVSASPNRLPLAPRQLDSTKTFVASPPSTPNTPCYSTQELYSLTQDFLTNFLYPNDKVQANKVNSTLFSEDVIGRVDITRNFLGRQLNTEYIFGLFTANVDNPNPDYFTLLGAPLDASISHWAGVGNVVSFSLIGQFQTAAVNMKVPVEIGIWLTFNDQRQISQYDATFRYIQFAFDTMAKIGMQQFHISDPVQFQQLVGQRLAKSICSVAAQNCHGPNQQYSDETSCMQYLTTQVRYGQAYEAGMNTLLCRMVHQGMVPIAPDVHCSHIGPSGGAYCVDDREYTSVVGEKLFTVSSFVAEGLPGEGNL